MTNKPARRLSTVFDRVCGEGNNLLVRPFHATDSSSRYGEADDGQAEACDDHRTDGFGRRPDV